MNNWLILTTDEYNKIKELCEANESLTIIEAKYTVPELDIWDIYFNRELTINEAFELGKRI